MFEMSDRAYRRAEQAAALIYPTVVVAGAALTADAVSGEPAGAGMFGLFVVWFAVVPAAFATGLLVLAVNGIYAARGGVPDRFNAAIGGVMVLTTPPMLAPVFYGENILPELLLVFAIPFAFVVGPLAILLHAFRVPTRLSDGISGLRDGTGLRTNS